jgi:uncharacterized protein DUF4375
MISPIRLSRRKAVRNPRLRWHALSEFLASADPMELSAVQTAAQLAYWYSTHIEAAGHEDYFSTRSRADCSQVVLALRFVGATEQASVLSAALKAVDAAGSGVAAEYDDPFLAGVELADLEEFDEAFELCARSVPDCLIEYLDKNEPEFIDWKP